MGLSDPRPLAIFFVITACVGCSSPPQVATESSSNAHNLVLADEQLVTTLQGEFAEIAGKDFIEFAKGSSTLSPGAEFRLERQALWLRAHPMISVRLVASGDGLEQVADRRLAMARAQEVQKHLVLVGVGALQISNIDVEPAQSGSKRRVRTKIDLIQSVQEG